MAKTMRVLDRMLVLLSVILSLVVFVDASSKSNRPLTSTSTSSLKSRNGEIDISPVNSNISSTAIHSEIITHSVVKEREKADYRNSEGSIARKKKKGKSNSNSNSNSNIGTSKRSSPGGSSISLRRIKKEYKDAVDMGIAYDWVNQRHIQRKSKTKANQTVPKTRNHHAVICLGPITTNLRHWHFSFRGAGDGLYSKGIYHGQIILPKDYPLSPPSVQMWTPSGRFVPCMDICLSASNYHPESWTPKWSIQGIVNALRLHMLSNPNEIGGKQSTHEETMEYARRSLEWKKTWVSSGNSRTKQVRITVDHRLLIEEGVLSSDGTTREETTDKMM